MRTIGMALAGLLAVGQAYASPDPAMMAKLQEMYPKTKFNQVNTSELPGVYEAVMGKNIAYVEETGRYFLFGRLYDMKQQKDLTQDRLEAAQKVDISAINTDWAITYTQGKGEREFYVFTDPDCPYCKKLEKTLAALDNVKIHIFMMPIDSLHPAAREKSNNVWCATDRAAAWKDLVIGNKEAPAKQCDTPLKEIAKVAFDLGINGTPTMLTPDGRKLSGARAVAAINDWLNRAQTVAKKEGTKVAVESSAGAAKAKE